MTRGEVIDSAAQRCCSALQAWFDGLRRRLAAKVERRTLTLCVLAAVLCGVVLAGGVALSASAPDETAVAGKEISSTAGEERVISDARCPECAVVESLREIGSADSDLRTRAAGGARCRANDSSARNCEVTLRRKDGSSHRFTDNGSGNWRPGERVILISGRSE